MDDWHTMDMRYLQRSREFEANISTQPEYPDPDNTPDWTQL